MTTQLDSSLGIAKESTYGVFTAPTSFVEFTDETLDKNLTVVEGTGMRPGRRTTTVRQRTVDKISVSGDVTVEASYAQIGSLLAAVFGADSVASVTSGVYQHIFTPSADWLPSYSLQKGIPTLGGGPAQPFSFVGMQANQLDFSVKNGGIPTAKVSFVGKDALSTEDGAPAYVSPSYPATGDDLLTFVGGAITVGGTVTAPTAKTLATGGTAVANITDADIQLSNNLDSAGYNLGGAGMRTRPAAALLAKVSGTLTAEFTDMTFWNHYLGQDKLTLVLTFTGGTIASGSNYVLQFHIPFIALDGDTPKAKNNAIVTQSIGFTGLQDNTLGLPMIQAILVNAVPSY